MFAIGATLGAAGVWVNHRNECAFTGQRESRASDIVVVFSYPGSIITWLQTGSRDWVVDEEWDYLLPISIWNGVFTCIVWLAVSSIGRILKRRKGPAP